MSKEERRAEILAVCGELFMKNGFEETGMTEIAEALGVARGMVYYYFDSKEGIMDALIEERSEKVLADARRIAKDRSLSPPERLFRAAAALHWSEEEHGSMLDYIHRPRNSLMHDKIRRLQMKEIPPILARVVEDGNRDGSFHCAHPLEAMEMVTAYINVAFDNGEPANKRRVEAFLDHLALLLGVKGEQTAPFRAFFKKEEV